MGNTTLDGKRTSNELVTNRNTLSTGARFLSKSPVASAHACSAKAPKNKPMRSSWMNDSVYTASQALTKAIHTSLASFPHEARNVLSNVASLVSLGFFRRSAVDAPGFGEVQESSVFGGGTFAGSSVDC